MGSIDLLLSSDGTSAIVEPRLRRLYSYWLERKGQRRFPARRDMDPLDFPYALGHVMLVDVLRDPLRFCVRIHGTEMVQRAHYDLTGRFLDELPDSDYRSYVIERCEGLVASGQPAHVHHDRVIDGRHHCYEAIWLPLGEDNINVTKLICALVYHDNRRSVRS